MKLTTITVLAVTAAALSACEYVPFTDANRIDSAKKRIAILSANPTTVRFSDVKAGPGGAVCGVFNAQEEGYPVRSELVWSGPLNFVTIKGQPNVVNNAESDCEKGVGAWSRCVNDGDEAKFAADVTACRAFQREQEKAADEQTTDLMRSSGLVATGNRERDQRTWDAYISASRTTSINIWDMAEVRASVDSGDLFKSVYNRKMRELPDNATPTQKVAAATAAATGATAESEALLKERGLV